MTAESELKKINEEQKETVLARVEEKAPYREILELRPSALP